MQSRRFEVTVQKLSWSRGVVGAFDLRETAITEPPTLQLLHAVAFYNSRKPRQACHRSTFAQPPPTPSDSNPLRPLVQTVRIRSSETAAVPPASEQTPH